MTKKNTSFTQQVGIEHPIIGGAMYPCSNPELVAAVSAAGGIGIVQPISLVFVNKWDFREGLRHIRSLTEKPIGLNLLIERSSKTYIERNRRWMEIALEEGVRFFVTALGNPDWAVKRIHAEGGIVYHDVTELKWAQKALDGGVDGLICVNNQAGGHAGHLSPQALYESLSTLERPLICAGGIGTAAQFREALDIGYAGVQLGTRFIATAECTAHDDYKNAILRAQAKDIVLSEKITGVPVSIINTPYIERVGTKTGPITKKLLSFELTKSLIRTLFALKSFWQLKQSLRKGSSYKDYFQAGKSVEGIDKIEPVADIIKRFVNLR